MKYVMYERHVATLEALPEDDREVYEVDPSGGFRLIPVLIPDIERMEAEIETKREELARKDATLRSLTINRALEEALDELGAHPRRKRVAVAYLADALDFEVREEAGECSAFVAGQFGAVSVASAVESWLSSPAGADYRLKGQPQSDGMFTGMARGLRSVH